MSRVDRSLALCVIAGVALAGCKSELPRRSPVAKPLPPVAARPPARSVEPSPASNTDPCALRLHDVSGALLLYYFNNRRLPATLDELNAFPDADGPIPLVCPASNLPYAYTTDGIQLVEKHARVIVYDPTPAHEGSRRWAITIRDAGGDKPLVMEVLSLPERFFLFRPPTATTLPAVP